MWVARFPLLQKTLTEFNKIYIYLLFILSFPHTTNRVMERSWLQGHMMVLQEYGQKTVSHLTVIVFSNYKLLIVRYYNYSISQTNSNFNIFVFIFQVTLQAP